MSALIKLTSPELEPGHRDGGEVCSPVGLGDLEGRASRTRNQIYDVGVVCWLL
jgi:hypothetical protein